MSTKIIPESSPSPVLTSTKATTPYKTLEGPPGALIVGSSTTDASEIMEKSDMDDMSNDWEGRNEELIRRDEGFEDEDGREDEEVLTIPPTGREEEGIRR